MYEQTVVLLARTTAFTVVCQACADLDARGEHVAHTAQGAMRLGPARPSHPRDPRRLRRPR